MKKSQAIITEMILKIQEQVGKLAFYENPYSPFHLQTTFQHVKKRQAVQKRIHPLLQRRQVQRLVMSVNHTKMHKPKRCVKCGSKNITVTKTITKMIIDIINIPKTRCLA